MSKGYLRWASCLVALGLAGCSSGSNAQRDAAVDTSRETTSGTNGVDASVSNDDAHTSSPDIAVSSAHSNTNEHTKTSSSVETNDASSDDTHGGTAISADSTLIDDSNTAATTTSPDVTSSKANSSTDDASTSDGNASDSNVDVDAGSSTSFELDSGGTFEPVGNEYTGPPVLLPGSELAVPEGCEFSGEGSSDVYFYTAFTCGDAGTYLSSSCSRQPDAWYCQCGNLSPLTTVSFTGVAETELRTFVSNFCTRVEALEPTAPEQCDVWSEVIETNTCVDHQRCYQSVELAPGIEVRVETHRNNLSCSPNGTDANGTNKWWCGCDAYPEREVSVLSADRSMACQGYRAPCFEDFEPEYGPGTCELTDPLDPSDEDECHIQENCVMNAPLPNGTMAQTAYEQGTSCYSREEAWDCTCMTFGAYVTTRFDVLSEEPCGEAQSPCIHQDEVTTTGDYECHVASEVTIYSFDNSCTQDIDCLKAAQHGSAEFDLYAGSRVACQYAEDALRCWCTLPNANFMFEPDASDVEQACAVGAPRCIDEMTRVLNP